jgi:hypothetical protein
VVSAESRRVSGLFIVMPYSVLALWYLPVLGRRREGEDASIRLLLGLVVAYFFFSTVLNPGNKGGLQWGPRYLMPVFGVLVVLSVKMLSEVPVMCCLAGRVLAAALVALAFVFELLGFSFVRGDEKLYANVLNHLRDDPAVAVVAYDTIWLSQMCSPLYFEKNLHFTDAPGTNRRYFSDAPATLRDYLEASKPYPNDRVLVLTHGKPLPALLPVQGGRSEEIAERFWTWQEDK